MKKYIKLFLAVVCICYSCNSETEKRQYNRNNEINVRDRIKRIIINEDDALIGSYARLYIANRYLIIRDTHPWKYHLHLLDKNDFRYITSIAPAGQGPGEIVNMGHIGYKEGDSVFYVSDHGKMKIFSYRMDSAVANPKYVPGVKMEIVQAQFPGEYQFINDSICLGRIISPTGNSGFNQLIGKWNINTGETVMMNYEHPDGVRQKRGLFALSVENALYVECYSNYDLMTVCDIDGNLKCNVYGPNWSDDPRYTHVHFGKVRFCRDKIVVSYSGKRRSRDNSDMPTKLMVFDLDGNYLKTLETGYPVQDFCYDAENHRLILNLDDEMQFAFLDMEGVVE